MVTGTMYVGLSGVETIKIPNISLEEFGEIHSGVSEGVGIIHLVDETWVNPSQVTYLKFVKN